MQTIKLTTEISNINGSESMKRGSFPYVSDTIVDSNRIRQSPDDRMIKPLWSACFMRVIIYATRQITALIKGYRSNA